MPYEIGQTYNVNIAAVKPPVNMLRNIDKESESYQILLALVQDEGLTGTLPCQVSPKGELYLVDGMHRLTAAKQLGIETVNVEVIKGLPGDDSVMKSISRNVSVTPTTQAELRKALLDYVAKYPNATAAEMAGKTNTSISWVRATMRLVKLSDTLRLKLDAGMLSVAAATMLCQISDPSMQEKIFNMTTQDQPNQLAAIDKEVRAVLSEIKSGTKREPGFHPKASVRKMDELRQVTPADAVAVVEHLGITTTEAAYMAAIKWAMSLDPDSVNKQEAEYNKAVETAGQRQKEAELARAKKKVTELEKAI